MKTKPAKVEKPPPSPSVVLGWLSPSGDLAHLGERFRKLDKDDKRAAVDDIREGFDPAATIALYLDDPKYRKTYSKRPTETL